jgi:hypothetical protein
MFWPESGPLVPPVISPWWMPPNLFPAQWISTNTGSGVFPVANQAYYYPIWLAHPIVVTTLWWQNGNGIAGNVDCGLYTDNGVRLVSTGSIAQAGSLALQTVDITDTPVPGGLIYLAFVSNSTSGNFRTVGPGTGGLTPGCSASTYIQTSAFPLPNPATFASSRPTYNKIFKVGALRAPRTVV